MKNLKAVIKKELPFFFVIPGLLWQFLFLFIPLCIILFLSFSEFSSLGDGWQQFSLKNYRTVFNLIHVRIILRSLLLAFGSSIACLLLSFPLAYYLAVHVKRWKNFLLFLLTLPFWTNFLILIYSWFYLLDDQGLINMFFVKMGLISQPFKLATSTFAIFMVMVYCYLPFMIMPLYSILEKLDKKLLEASADLGANWFQTFYRITLPLALPGIKTGMILVFVATFGEFAIPSLIGGSKTLLVGSLISYYFLIARNKPVGSAFTMLSGFVLVVLIAIAFYVVFMKNKKKYKGIS